jgi:hypothetical protein
MDIIIFGYKPKEMKRLLLLSTFILLSVVGLNAQTWTYANKTSDFDGSYKIVSANGYGGEFPYQSPRFIVRNTGGRIDLYISNLGYTGCDGNELIIVFDSKRKYYVTNSLLIESTDKDALFISGIRESGNSEVLTIYHLLDEVKKSSKMSVRFRSDCKTNDFFYKLDGSTSALNKMFGRSIQDAIKSFEEDKVKMAIAEKEWERKQAKKDSIAKIKSDSLKIWRKQILDKRKLVLDSVINSFLENAYIDGVKTDYKIAEESRQMVKKLLQTNANMLKPEDKFIGFNLSPTNQGRYRLMIKYIDHQGVIIQKYLYKSLKLTSSGELFTY